MSTLRVEHRGNGIAVVTLDVPDAKVNVISPAFLGEFSSVLDTIEQDPSVRACVLASGKPDNFIAGANLDEVKAMTGAAEASAFVREGHKLLDRVAASRKPFVAAIHGAALGGGLEVALACRYRIATAHPRTILGLPEVMVGLIPAGGGTQRLPRLVGIVRALPMMLTGQRVRAKKAMGIGLVDEVVAPDQLEVRAVQAAAGLADGTLKARGTSLAARIANAFPLRGMIVSKARAMTRAKTRGLYPAALAIIECVETGLRDGFATGQAKEIELFGKLAVGSEAKSLIWLFDAMTELKKLPAGEEPKAVSTLAVLGAGLMGEGIASVSLPLCDVVVKDISDGALAKVKANIERGIEKRLASASLGAEEAAQQKARLRLTTSVDAIANAQLVIEAVFERLDLKRQVLAECESVLAPDAVFASNTSAIPIQQIAAEAAHPERVLGMHYFSPVPKMPLLEIITTPRTAVWAIATACAYGTAQGKTVIVVRDGPGFYTTRILAPFMNEAIMLLDEGAEIRALDSALKDFGFPIGPVTLLDEVGIDVAAHVSSDLGTAFAARGAAPSPSLTKLHEAGYAGRKNGRGFYRYDGKKGPKQVNDEIYIFFGGASRKAIDKTEMIDRLALMMINEAAHCLQEGVIASARDGDVGAVLGLGFPPFRGGPFHHVDAVGVSSIVSRMRELESRLGPRFRPADTLTSLAAEGGRFYVR